MQIELRERLTTKQYRHGYVCSSTTLIVEVILNIFL
jgi:hypothetical protein